MSQTVEIISNGVLLETVVNAQIVEIVAGGPSGQNGIGLPPGGTTNQVAAKKSNDDYDIEWVDASGGGGGGGAVSSVNGQTGTVVLDLDDIGDGVTAKQYIATEKTKLAGIATGATANSTDSQLRDRSTHTGTQTASTISDFAAASDARITLQKAANNGLATLDGGGKIPTSQLPALAITSTFVVNSQSAQLALTAQEGDVAVRTDLNKSFIHNGGTAGTMSDWQELLTPTDTVISVNGQTGAVTLTKTDVGLGNVDNTSDANKPVSTAQAGADAAVQGYSIQRGNHTGSQTASTISDFAATVRSTVLTGLSLATSQVIAATDTVLQALGYLQAQITALTSTVSGKQETLVSGTNIKTINGSSVLGSGDLVVSGSGATWGSINGTLSNQTDLQNALNAKVNGTTTITVSTSAPGSPATNDIWVDTN